MTITINDRRRPAAFGLLAPGDPEMNKSDCVLVQPTASYLEGAEHKHAHSPAYEVTRAHAVELTANGFALMLDGSAHTQEEPTEVAAHSAENMLADRPAEATINNDGKPRGRRANPRD